LDYKETKINKTTKRFKKTNNAPKVTNKHKSRSIEQAEAKLQGIGLDTTKFRSSSLAKSRKRRRSLAGPIDSEMVDENNENNENNNEDLKLQRRGRSLSAGGRSLSARGGRSRSANARSRSRNRTPSIGPGTGFSDMKVKEKAEKMARKAQHAMNQDARQGESDRRFFQKKPKHLFSGKRGIGKTDRR